MSWAEEFARCWSLYEKGEVTTAKASTGAPAARTPAAAAIATPPQPAVPTPGATPTPPNKPKPGRRQVTAEQRALQAAYKTKACFSKATLAADQLLETVNADADWPSAQQEYPGEPVNKKVNIPC